MIWSTPEQTQADIVQELVNEREMLVESVHRLVGTPWLELWELADDDLRQIRREYHEEQQEAIIGILSDEIRAEIDADIIAQISMAGDVLADEGADRNLADPEAMRTAFQGVMQNPAEPWNPPPNGRVVPLERTVIEPRERYLRADWTMEVGGELPMEMDSQLLDKLVEQEMELDRIANRIKALPPDDMFDMDK
jgi:hypothetical protein